MLHTPKCQKCGGNTCLISYRRSGGEPQWTCVRCAGLFLGRGAPQSESRNTSSRAERSSLETAPLPSRAPDRSKYTGPRVSWDPMR